MGDDLGPCESPRDRHLQEKCAPKCVGTPRAMRARGDPRRGIVSLCLHLFFSTKRSEF